MKPTAVETQTKQRRHGARLTPEGQGRTDGSWERGGGGDLEDCGGDGGTEDNGVAGGKVGPGGAKGLEGRGTARSQESHGRTSVTPDWRRRYNLLKIIYIISRGQAVLISSRAAGMWVGLPSMPRTPQVLAHTWSDVSLG